jgi:hypothetical protein
MTKRPEMPKSSKIYFVWSGSQKVHPYFLTEYTEALEWKNKVNDMGRHASIEILDTDSEGKVVWK